MDWEDTVISDERIIDLLNKYIALGVENRIGFGKQVAKVQAESSFKEGQKARRQEVVNLLSKIAAELDTDQDRGQFYDAIHRLYHEWQEFLKSEGIE